jgi:hypothetical protein
MEVSLEYPLQDCYYQLNNKRRQIIAIVVTLRGQLILEKSKIQAITDNVCRNYFSKILINNLTILEQQQSIFKYITVNEQPTCEYFARRLFSQLDKKYPFMKLKKITVVSDGYSVDYGK